MSFYKEIEPFNDYIHSIRKLKNYLTFDLKFPNKWVLPKNMLDDGQIIPYESDDANMKGMSFVTEIEEMNISSTIAKINKIIRINKEKEQKEQLFKEYVEKLKSTFEGNDLNKLQKLYFDFEQEIPNLDIEEYERQSENSELVGKGEEERQDGGGTPQIEVHRTNKKVKEGRLVPQT